MVLLFVNLFVLLSVFAFNRNIYLNEVYISVKLSMDRTSLIKGHLEMCVLSILSKKKSYGYEIMKELEVYNLKLKRSRKYLPHFN